MILGVLRTLDNRISWIVIVLILLFCSYFIWKANSAPLSDFAGYYFGAKMWLDGLFDVSVYFPSDFNFTIERIYQIHTYVAYTPFPPFTAIVFSPLAFFSVAKAKLIFNCFNCFWLIWLIFRLINYLGIRSYLVLLVPLVFYIPLRNNFSYGQGYIFLMFLLFEGYLAFERKNRILGSLLWSFAFLFKIFPCILVIYLVKRKDWKSVVLISVIGGGLLGLSFFALGKEVWLHYFSIMSRLSYGELNDPFAVTFQSLFMFLKNNMVYDMVFNPFPLIKSKLLFDSSWIICQSLILAVLILWKAKSPMEDFTEFGIWMMATLLLSPNGSTYSLLALLFIFVSLISVKSTESHWLLVCLIGVICNFPLHLLKTMPIYLQFPKLYGLIVLFVFMFWTCQKFTYSHLLVIFLISICLFCLKFSANLPKTDSSEFLTPKPTFDMGHRLEIQNDSVFMLACLENDWEYKSLGFKAFQIQNVSEFNNQLYFQGNAITIGTDFKRSPVQISKNKVIYLSDQGHGIGFFVPKVLEFH